MPPGIELLTKLGLHVGRLEALDFFGFNNLIRLTNEKVEILEPIAITLKDLEEVVIGWELNAVMRDDMRRRSQQIL